MCSRYLGWLSTRCGYGGYEPDFHGKIRALGKRYRRAANPIHKTDSPEKTSVIFPDVTVANILGRASEDGKTIHNAA